MTRLSWDAAEPDPAPGDPGAYARLARDLGDSAEGAEAAYRHLQGLASEVDETIWSGSAADAFAGELAELPPQPEKFQASYAMAAKAMATYGRVLSDLQHGAAGALSRLEQAGAEEAEGRRARDVTLADAAAAAAGDHLAVVPADTAALDRVIDDAGDGATEAWRYDGEGNLIQHTDANGNLTTTTYTHFDLPAAEVGPDGSRLAFTYDTELRLVAVTNAAGLVWRYEYDPADNLVGEVDFNGRELHYAHDATGQLIERTNGVGETTRYESDALGNVIEQRWTTPSPPSPTTPPGG